jgi:hypothetical protein
LHACSTILHAGLFFTGDDSADSESQGIGSDSEVDDGGSDIEEGGLESLIAGTSLEEV